MSSPAAAGDRHRFDVSALERWMAANVDGYAGPLSVEQFKGGQSNPTYRVSTPSRDYVVRRKPPGELLKGAHAVEREAAVMAALGPTGFPVPRIYGLCEDAGIIGTVFFVMEMVEGRIFWDAAFRDVPRDERHAYFDAMNATIAALHNTDYATIGLSGYGRPGNYFERQIARWTKQYVEDEAAGRDEHMDRLVEWLPANIPADDTTALVHGDFRCDNMIFDAEAPRVIAVLDWELSTLGSSLADFAYHAMMYRMPAALQSGLASEDLATLGLPSEADYVAAYCRLTGREALPGYDFAVAFNMFRFAAIVHGIKGRVLRGTAASAEAQSRAEAFPKLAALAWEQALVAGAR